MALDYYLTIQNIGNDISPDQIRDYLARSVSFQINPISGILMKPGLTVNTFEEDDESAFGSPWPDLCVAFRIDKFSQYEKGISSMLKAVFRLISDLDGDMIFSSENEEIILRRMSGKLTLGESPHFRSGSGLLSSRSEDMLPNLSALKKSDESDAEGVRTAVHNLLNRRLTQIEPQISAD